MRNPLRRLYNWVLHWADTPYGGYALASIAFSESVFFPIPPDILLIPLALSKPKRAFTYATITTALSVIGGIAGYIVGLWLMERVGIPLLRFYSAMDEFHTVADYYNRYNAVAVGIAGFTPIPFKVFTIAAGACRINFPTFVLAATVSRGARFFIVSTLLFFFGKDAKTFIDKYFNILALIFGLLILLGFVLLRFVI